MTAETGPHVDYKWPLDNSDGPGDSRFGSTTENTEGTVPAAEGGGLEMQRWPVLQDRQVNDPGFH
jgi:hypothetical protein